MGKHFSPRIVTDGLVLCLDAANRDSYAGSGLSWNNLSTTSHSATFAVQPTFSQDFSGNLTGGSGATTTYTQVGSNNHTQSIWMRWNGSNQASSITSLGDGGTVGLQLFMGTGTNTAGAGNRVGILYAGTHWNVLNSSALMTANWTNLVITRDSTTSTLYQDGSVIGSTTIAPQGQSSTLSFSFNCNNSMGNLFFYSRSLSAIEVNQNFNALRGRYRV